MVTPRTRIMMISKPEGGWRMVHEVYTPTPEELAKEAQRRKDYAERAAAHTAYLNRICAKPDSYKIHCECCGGVAAYGNEEEGCTILCTMCVHPPYPNNGRGQ